MPLRKRASKKYKTFNMPVSYKVGDSDNMKDARNVCTIQDVLETRHGISRWNSTAFSAAPQSISFFIDNSENKYIIIKDGTVLYKANASGAHTSIKTGLTSSVKHDAVSIRGRHFIALGADGLFSYDGATFTQLGQAVPSAPTVGASGSGNTLTASDYQVAVTFYASTLGYETNIGTASSTVTVSSGEQIDVSNIPSTADNGFIDKVRVYVKDVTNNSAWLFWDEINLGVTTETIDDDPSSTQTPPTKNGAVQSGGGKYLAVFGQQLAYAGNGTFQSDVFFSEPLLPDAFDGTSTSRTINIAGNGPITGLGVGYFDGDNQNPYLVAFKRNHIELYTEASGSGQQVIISTDIGCISHKTIKTIEGDVFFMSTKGWHRIKNGRLTRTSDKSDSIDNGLIKDIFNRSGFTFELNKNQYSSFFSVFYPPLGQYMTFVSEGSNNNIYKSYNFEFEIGGFRPYEFDVYFTGAALGENNSGEDVVYLCGENGYIYTHSINETQGTDIDRDGNNIAIDAFAQLYWLKGEDLDASHNFGPIVLEALSQDNPVTVKCFLDYSQETPTDLEYSFSDDGTGFILDISQLDIDTLGDGRTIKRYVGGIYRSGQSLLIGFYKSQQGESMSLLGGQIDVQKNGNSN